MKRWSYCYLVMFFCGLPLIAMTPSPFAFVTAFFVEVASMLIARGVTDE